MRTQGWPLGGWSLVDDHRTVVGYHWHQPYPALDPDWTCPASAFYSFIPDPAHRIRLRRAGWRTERDVDDVLLDLYLCGSAPLGCGVIVIDDAASSARCRSSRARSDFRARRKIGR